MKTITLTDKEVEFFKWILEEMFIKACPDYDPFDETYAYEIKDIILCEEELQALIEITKQLFTKGEIIKLIKRRKEKDKANKILNGEIIEETQKPPPETDSLEQKIVERLNSFKWLDKTIPGYPKPIRTRGIKK